MNFGYRGSRGDLESGFADFIPERRNVRYHGAGRSVNTNSMAFLVTVLLLFMILNSHQMSPNFLLWLGMGIFVVMSGLRVYAICQQLQAQAQAHAAAAAAAAGGIVGHTEFRLRMPPSIAFATRGRLQSLRLQLALLDREFDDLDYDALRALDGDNPPGVSSLSESEINALPLHKHKGRSNQASSSNPPSSDNGSAEHSVGSDTGLKKTDVSSIDSVSKGQEEELTCSVCLEQVVDGELVRSLPCCHQFHANCIDQWLRQQATCPVCKFRLGMDWQDGSNPQSVGFI